MSAVSFVGTGLIEETVYLVLKLYVFKNYSGDHKLFLKSLKIPGTFKKNHNHL